MHSGPFYYSGRFVGVLICRDKRQILLICRGKNGKKRQKRQKYTTTLSYACVDLKVKSRTTTNIVCNTNIRNKLARN